MPSVSCSLSMVKLRVNISFMLACHCPTSPLQPFQTMC